MKTSIAGPLGPGLMRINVTGMVYMMKSSAKFWSQLEILENMAKIAPGIEQLVETRDMLVKFSSNASHYTMSGECVRVLSIIDTRLQHEFKFQLHKTNTNG